MKTIMQILTFLAGLFLIFYSLVASMDPVAVWSDFQAFGAKVAENKLCSEVLKYGGESSGDSFDNLTDMILDLQNQWYVVTYVGILLVAMAIIQFAINFWTANKTKSG